MDRRTKVVVTARTLIATVALLGCAGMAEADVNVRGAARFEGSKPGNTNDFHIVYDSTLGPFAVTGSTATDNRGEGWTAATGAGPAGSSPTTRTTSFTRAGSASFSWLEVSIQITGPRLCSMRILDKWWTVNGTRQTQAPVGGFGMLQDTDPTSGNTRVWVLNDHDDLTLRVSEISLDLFTSANLPNITENLAGLSPYTYSLPTTVLAPHTGVSFTFPRGMVPDEWSTVQGRSELWNASTGTWETDGSFRYQHEYLPVPGPGVLAALGTGLVMPRRRRVEL